MILMHSRPCSSPASEPSVPNQTGRNISIYRHENYAGKDENTSRKKKEGNRTKQNFPPTLRTESNLLVLAFEALCDLALPILFSLMPRYTCFT